MLTFRSLRSQVRAGVVVVTFLVTGPAHARDLGQIFREVGVGVAGFCGGLLDTPAKVRARQDVARAEIEAKVLGKLGFLPTVEYALVGIAGVQTATVTARGPEGELLGDMNADILSPTHVRMGLTKMYADKYKRKGISELLFARLMREHPRTLRTSAHLAIDNRKFIMEKLADGVPCERAVMLSPAARMQAHLGFTRLLKAPSCFDLIELVLGR